MTYYYRTSLNPYQDISSVTNWHILYIPVHYEIWKVYVENIFENLRVRKL